MLVAEPGARPSQQRGGPLEPQRLVLEEPRQPFSGGGLESAQTQVLADALLMLRDRLLPAGVGVDRLGVGAQLQGREPQDLPVVAVLDALAKAGVAFVALKENIRVEGKRDIQTKVMTTLFALFAEVERDLISERTREGLAKARASGRKLGRPKGSLGVSRLDGKEDEIQRFLELGVSKTAIAKLTGVSRTALYSFMTTRGLRPSR